MLIIIFEIVRCRLEVESPLEFVEQQTQSSAFVRSLSQNSTGELNMLTKPVETILNLCMLPHQRQQPQTSSIGSMGRANDDFALDEILAPGSGDSPQSPSQHFRVPPTQPTSPEKKRDARASVSAATASTSSTGARAPAKEAKGLGFAAAAVKRDRVTFSADAAPPAISNNNNANIGVGLSPSLSPAAPPSPVREEEVEKRVVQVVPEKPQQKKPKVSRKNAFV